MRVLVERVHGADWAAAILQPAPSELPSYLAMLAGEVLAWASVAALNAWLSWWLIGHRAPTS